MDDFNKQPKNIHPKFKPLISPLRLQHENTSLKNQITKLNDENGFDNLTGLLNDKALRAKITEQYHDRRSTATKEITFAYLDLDDLKIKNGLWGHDGGNKYIQEFAISLRNYFRDNDYIYRIHGSNSDEIGILIESNQVDFLKERLETFQNENPNYSFSYGVKCGSRDKNGNLDLNKTIHDADMIMIGQKNEKKNGVKYAI